MKGGSPVPPVQGLFSYSSLPPLTCHLFLVIPQGGFLVMRPSMERFEELRSIIRKGDYGHQGWGGSGIGNFWGGQTIQGILAYYYHSIHHGDGEELNRCIYNVMADNPYHAGTTRCLNGDETCEDCRLQVMDKVKEAHFTICQKPWTCTYHNNPRNMVLCQKLHDKWFEMRDEFEKSLSIDTSYRNTETRYKASLGICKGYGDDKYLPIPHSLNHPVRAR
jgi:hypothetical protein